VVLRQRRSGFPMKFRRFQERFRRIEVLAGIWQAEGCRQQTGACASGFSAASSRQEQAKMAMQSRLKQ
jgi:hypothetical protein